jgi:hypothetical protein
VHDDRDLGAGTELDAHLAESLELAHKILGLRALASTGRDDLVELLVDQSDGERLLGDKELGLDGGLSLDLLLGLPGLGTSGLVLDLLDLLDDCGLEPLGAASETGNDLVLIGIRVGRVVASTAPILGVIRIGVVSSGGLLEGIEERGGRRRG